MLLSRPAGGRASAVVPGSLALGPAGRSESEGPLPGLSWLSWLPLPPVMRSGAAAAGEDSPLDSAPRSRSVGACSACSGGPSPAQQAPSFLLSARTVHERTFPRVGVESHRMK